MNVIIGLASKVKYSDEARSALLCPTIALRKNALDLQAGHKPSFFLDTSLLNQDFSQKPGL
ncbi:MAG: hypothetical protein ABI180_11700 [Microcoleus sp.]